MKQTHFRKALRGLGLILFVLYLALLAYLVFFSKEFGRQDNTSIRYNIVPFRTITNFFYYTSWDAFAVNILGNILAFMPFGVLMPVVFKKTYDRVYVHLVVLWSFTVSLFIEMIQMLSKVGAFDVDDLMLNTLGGLVGYWIYYFYSRRYHKVLRKKKETGRGR